MESGAIDCIWGCFSMEGREEDNSVAFRILSEPLLVTGLGVAFATNDSRGLDSQLNDTFAQLREDGTLEQIVGKYLENPSQYLEVDTIGT